MTMPSAEEWIERLKMKPHPEGGFFVESYRARDVIPASALGPQYSGPRAVATAIYFLLRAGDRSRLHRMLSDEMWHFYCGEPLTVAGLSPSGDAWTVRLGIAVGKGEKFQHVVPAGEWFGAHMDAPRGYSLVGCTVSPGFDYTDWELADGATLRGQFASASSETRAIIEQLT